MYGLPSDWDREAVTRLPNETMQMFGTRRRAQINRWEDSGVPLDEIARRQRVSMAYVREAVGIFTPRYYWRPPPDVLAGPFPTKEEARAEEPLIAERPRLMSPEQSILRAIQMWRWYQAGLSLAEIGERHKITRERVRKVLDHFGFPRTSSSPWVSGDPDPGDDPDIIDQSRGRRFRDELAVG